MTAVVGKLFQIVDCIATGEDDSMSLATLTRETGIPKATLYRLLGDLVEPGIIDHAAGGYALGSRLFDLGARVPLYRHLREASSSHLEELTLATRDSAHLATLCDNEVLYLDKVPGSYAIRIPTAIGRRLPPHCTALGKALLANAKPGVVEQVARTRLRPRTRNTVVMPGLLMRQLDRIRDAGVATEIEEFRLGVGCIAAPIRDDRGRVVAAISLSGDPRTKNSDRMAERMRQAAADISRDYLDLVRMSSGRA